MPETRAAAIHPRRPWHEPMVGLCVAWAVGLLVGWAMGRVLPPWALLAPAAMVWLTATALCLRRRRWAGVWPIALVATALTAAGWWQVRHAPPQADSLASYVTDDRRLVDLTGHIDSPPRLHTDRREGLARYMYRPPDTTCLLRARTLHTPRGDRPVHGGLLVRIAGLDARWRPGDRVRVRGWMRSVGPPINPGERDYAAAMARRGVVGRLTLKSLGNARLIQTPDRAAAPGARLGHAHRRLGDAAAGALRHGMVRGEDDRAAAALIEALVLGRRCAELEPLYDAFRKTGLAHLLSISGLHVGLLAGGLWALVAMATSRPRAATLAAAAAVVVYLLIVPARVPVVRAGFMTVALCLGLSWSRRLSSISLMAAIALAWLVGRPGDLFDAGFQLSFGIVTAIILFSEPLARRLGRESPWADPIARAGWPARIRRRAVDYIAVSLIAWLVSMPLVAYHFGLVSPLAVVMGVAVMPLAALMLWLGFVKILVTALWSAAGALLAPPLLSLGRTCEQAVRLGVDLPGAWAHVPQPSALWAAAVLAVVVALLWGRFAGRRWALAACAALCIGWLYAPALAERWRDRPLRVDMLAVGDGSCFLIRSDEQAMLFDCGSINYAQIGRHTVVPALRALNVGHLDAIVISHPDYDHFSGTLDVVDHVAVDRVITTRHTFADAAADPNGATAYLLDELRRRRIPIQRISAGRQLALGRARVTALWPPPAGSFEHNNDASIVLAFEAAGRRLLMCGDIQAVAMKQMLDRGIDLKADVTDLPHHGSFPPGAGRWLAAVDPAIVLQSSSPRRLRWDKWAGRLGDIDRWITARHGMVSLTVKPGAHGGHGGRITARPFLSPQ